MSYIKIVGTIFVAVSGCGETGYLEMRDKAG